MCSEICFEKNNFSIQKVCDKTSQTRFANRTQWWDLLHISLVETKILNYRFHLDTNEERRQFCLGMGFGSLPPILKISLKLPRRRLFLDLLRSCKEFGLSLVDSNDRPPLQRLLRRKPLNISSGERKLISIASYN